MKKRWRAVDMFCGAGGTTIGAQAAGVDVVLAINHWRTAIQSHRENHPATRHICARIDDIDPRHDRSIPSLDLILASPECTHHSNARGSRPINDQKRATPWHVILWTEVKRPKWVQVENVREFLDWGPLNDKGRPIKSRKGEIFRQWVRCLEALGYQVDWALLNAADFGAATKRTRLFIVARRGRSKKAIPWPEQTHTERQWRPAASIIDWSLPCLSIFDRRRPLAGNTLKRIETGLHKFVGEQAEPFLVTLRRNMNGRSTGQPLPTITAGAEHHGLAVPFISQFHNGDDGPNRNYDPRRPLPTLDTQNRYGIVAPYLLAVNHGGSDDRSKSVREPMATLTTKTGHSLVLPFLTKYYGTGSVQPVTEPVDTITTKDRFGLATASLTQTMQKLHVVDIGFRMLEPHELAAAQGFPDGYLLFGSKADQVKQIGNSVSPPVAEALCRTIMEAG